MTDFKEEQIAFVTRKADGMLGAKEALLDVQVIVLPLLS